MSTQHKKVSIIMSTYNEYKSGALQKAVLSVISQTYKNFELVIIGDNTQYESQIASFLKKLNDKRIKFINLKKRYGIDSPGTVPKIKGIEKSDGELISFLDADNQYFQNHLKKCVLEFLKDKKLDLVYGNTVLKIQKTDNKLLNKLYKHIYFIWTKPDWTKKREKLIMKSNFLDMSDPVFTRKAYLDSGGLNPYCHASDWALWKKMIKSGHNNFKHINHLGVIYNATDLKHFVQYFLFMIAQNLKLPYSSQKLKIIQKIIKKRMQKKHR